MIPDNILILPNYTQTFFLQLLVENAAEKSWELKSYQDVIPELGMPDGTITGIGSGRAPQFQKEDIVLGRFYRIDGPNGYLMISVPAGRDSSGKKVYLIRVLRINLTQLGNGRDRAVIPPLNPADLGFAAIEEEYPLAEEQKEQIELAFGRLNGLSTLPPDPDCAAIGTMLGDAMLHHELQLLNSVPSPAAKNIRLEGEPVNDSRTLLVAVCVGMLLLFVLIIAWRHALQKPPSERATGNNVSPAVAAATAEAASDEADSPFAPSSEEAEKAAPAPQAGDQQDEPAQNPSGLNSTAQNTDENGNQPAVPSASADAHSGDMSEEDADDADELADFDKESQEASAEKSKPSAQESASAEPEAVKEDRPTDPQQTAQADPMPENGGAAQAGAQQRQAMDAAIDQQQSENAASEAAQTSPSAEESNRQADRQAVGVNGDAPVIEDDSNIGGEAQEMQPPQNTQDTGSDSDEVVLPAGPQADPTVATAAQQPTADSSNTSTTNPYSRDYEATGTAGAALVDSGEVPTNPEEGNGASADDAASEEGSEPDGASVPGDAAAAAGTVQKGADEQKAAKGTLAQRSAAAAKDDAKAIVAGNNVYE